MLSKLIEIAIKSALENYNVKEKPNKQNKIIDLDKNNYKVLE